MFLAILIIAFICLLLLEVPIAFAVGIATLLAAISLGDTDVLQNIASDMANSVSSFTLLAIPFFILAGDLMGAGGLARRLINFASALVGRIPGGLSLVNTLTCMLFGSISGSAAAAVSSIGNTLIPEMNKKNYGKDFNVAVTTAGSITGLLIPPSNSMIVYAVVASGVSISSLFLAGIVPGLLLGFVLMVTCLIICKKKGYGQDTAGQTVAFVPAFFSALPSLLLVVIVLGGIFAGWFTATEASAIAVVWSLLLACVFYREIPLRELPAVIARSARTTGVVLFLVAASSAMSQLLTAEQVPQLVSATLLSLSDNPIVILLIINIALLLVGTFMDITPAILIFTPIFLPVAIDLGMDPIHFGILLIANLSIGLCTPPVGTCLFVGCSVGKAKIAEVSRAMLPFYIAMILVLVAITYIPSISLWLPSLFE
ncbi:C4-dicarboxylate TRAP transporter large permease protein DctM [Rubritalea halochordaticola]|uniref:C4-dicarboxylate TRAP transporter large permease protein DctM n=1 Tax=Rubritalea halochordaticola TaxID=714537 RepID=A0ABP9V079_9BACT